ncbi:MFS transporter [Micromonospora sp. NPDC049559]|uniref:MFS transporter n=1 Tax=Micromonospora sp. NPDC049559 TaxID=3155923 RepID=UPI003439A994
MIGADAAATAGGQSRGHPWALLAVLLLGQFMALLDVTIVNVALPVIGRDLHSSGAALQLVVGGYTICYAMLLITGARLGDLYGRRRMYLLGAVGFTVGSLLCGVAPTSLFLVAARFLQGAAAAVMVPQVMSVIQMRFTGPVRARALSAYGAVLSLGAVLGLVLGGVLVEADLFGTGWRPVFLVNVPLGALLIALVPRLVPADEPTGRRRLDLGGLVVSAAAVFLVVLPLVEGHELAWPAWTFLALAAGVLLAAVFVPIERAIVRRGGDPLLNLEVVRAPGLGAGLVTLLLMQVGYGGFLFSFALHLQSGLGDGALRAGLTFVPMAALFGIVGFSWRALPRRAQPVLPGLGLVLCVAGYLTMSAVLRDGSHGGPWLWAALVGYGAGMGASFSPLLTQSLVHVPPTRAADASGLFTTTMQLGQLTGVAAFGTVFLSVAQPFTVASSARAVSGTFDWLALLAAVGAVAGLLLARTVVRSQAAGAEPPRTAVPTDSRVGASR